MVFETDRPFESLKYHWATRKVPYKNNIKKGLINFGCLTYYEDLIYKWLFPIN